MVDIYTAQYRYSGEDRLDITVKSAIAPGDILAPTWDMVKDVQCQKLNEWNYTIKYYSLIISRIMTLSEDSRLKLDMIISRPSVTLVCFCPAYTFCHRVLAARMLEELGAGRYHGERLF